MARLSTDPRNNDPIPYSTFAKVSNALVEAFVRNNNLVAIKTLFYIAKANIEVPNQPFTTLSLDTDNLCSYCNINIKSLHRNIEQMVETSISITDEKTKSYMAVISKADFQLGTTKLDITMPKQVLELIWQVKNRFTVIDVPQLMNLNSKHSLKMIQILELINGFDDYVAKAKVYTLKELNFMFGTNYSQLFEFERGILTTVKEELDANSKLSFTYDKHFIDNPKGKGRPVANGIKIYLRQNTPQGTLDLK